MTTLSTEAEFLADPAGPGLVAGILARKAVAAADAAYTAAVSVAAGTGDWGPVQAAATVAKKARLSLAAEVGA